MWQIRKGLYLGTEDDAGDMPALQTAGITHILNCTCEIECHFPAKFAYRQLGLKDPDPDLGSHIQAACQFIDEGLESGAVLVDCQGAISRSPSIVLAWLCRQGATLEGAVAELTKFLQTRPNRVFLEAINEHYQSGLSLVELDALIIQLGKCEESN